MRYYLQRKQSTYKNSINEFNIIIENLDKLNKEFNYIVNTKIKMEEDMNFLGVETLENEILDNYVEITNLEKTLKENIILRQEDAFIKILDVLNNKLYLAMIVHNKARLWEYIAVLLVFINLIICILLKNYTGNWAVLVWVVIDLCECLPLYFIAKYKFNSFKKQLIKCIDMCIPYKGK